MEEQAKKAKDYLAYADEKRVLEIGLWLNTLEKSGKVLREQEDKILVARNQDEEVENQIQEIQAREETIFLEMNSHAAKEMCIRDSSGIIQSYSGRRYAFQQ